MRANLDINSAIEKQNERHFGVALDELVFGWADLKYLAGVQETAQQGRANRDA